MLYSTVGVLRRSDLRRRPFEARGRLVCPILSQQRASMRAMLIINPRSRYLKFFESLIAIGSHGNVHGMSISGLALDFTIVNPVQPHAVQPLSQRLF